MKKQLHLAILASLLCLCFPASSWAQKITGYVQAQYQAGEQDAALKVGAPNENPEESFDRIGIRRGRIRLTHEATLLSGAFELDLTEKGLSLKDAYLNIKAPWWGSCSVQAGIFGPPFGYEINYSTSQMESPERSILCQTLFPDEKDVGVMLRLQADKTSPWHFLKLEAGLFTGNGIRPEIDNRRDFSGRLSADKALNNHIKISGGLSYYNGSVYQGTESVFTMSGNRYIRDYNPDNQGRFAKREYLGIDAQFNMVSCIGKSQLRAEHQFGQQPGNSSGSKSPNAAGLPANDTFKRDFSGGYILFVQDLGKSPVSAVLRYDWYDPNTKVAGNAIGVHHTGKGDAAIWSFGFGLLWQAAQNIRLQAHYEINWNETSENLQAYTQDRKDDVLTLRLQCRF